MRLLASARSVATLALTLTVLLWAAPAAGQGNNNVAFCNTTGADMNSLQPAIYSGFLAGRAGYIPITIKSAWCGSLNDTVCNVTDYAFTIVSGTQCIAAFQSLLTPISFNTTTKQISAQLWGPADGVVAALSISCNTSGTSDTATFQGPVVEQPSWTYNLQFDSKVAC